MNHLPHLDSALRECIENCRTCHETCLSMAATHCLEIGGTHTEPAHFRLMLDCAEICATSANFMLRHSERHGLTCGICAEICSQCAKDCRRIGGMEECAQACERCAASCAEMAAAHQLKG